MPYLPEVRRMRQIRYSRRLAQADSDQEAQVSRFDGGFHLGKHMLRTINLLVLGLFCGSGCTHLALERAAIGQASTTSDLQFRQVLDNLAMFACNPNALAWHMKLSGASIQVTDQGTGAFSATIEKTVFPFWTPTATAQRGIVNQWAGLPTVDPDNLELLNLAYQKALNPQDPDGQITRGLYDKIREIALHYNIVLSKDTLDQVIDHSEKNDAEKWKLKLRNDNLHKQFDKVFAQLAKLSLPASDVQVDNYAMKLYSKVTEETRGEAREKLAAQQQLQKNQIAQTRVGVEDQVVQLTRDVGDVACISRYPAQGAAMHNPHDIAQAELQIKILLEFATLPKYQSAWVGVARSRRGVPHCACYVGHTCKCGCESHVWVPRDQLGTLRDFTIAILTLAPIESQETPQSANSGTVTYSPTVSGGGH